MKEVKTPKKPLAIYYTIVLLLILLLNVVLVPWMNERQIKEVDYGTFMSRWTSSPTRSSSPIRTTPKSTRPA